MSNKYAWTWYIKEDQIDEYLRMHGNVWEDVLKDHTAAGIKNYSIFQNKNQFFYVYECDDMDYALNFIANSKACKEWDAITSKMVEGSFDWGNSGSFEFMEEVFYLE